MDSRQWLNQQLQICHLKDFPAVAVLGARSEQRVLCQVLHLSHMISGSEKPDNLQYVPPTITQASLISPFSPNR